MSRSVWIVLIGSALLVMLIAAIAVAALVFIPRYRANQSLALARQFVSEGKPELSRRPYKQYLYKNGDDLDVVEEYIKVCENVVHNRRIVLADAGRLLAQIGQRDPDDQARQAQLRDFYRKYRMWDELERTVIRDGSDLAAMQPEQAYDLVVARQELRRLKEAAADLQQYIALGYELRDTPLRLARTYVALGDQTAADRVFPALIAEHPDISALHYYYAAYLLDHDDIDAASEQMALVPADKQDTADFVVTAVRLAMGREDYPGAIAAAENALDTYKDNVDLRLNYILALQRSGKRDAAIKFIQAMDPVMRIDSPGIVLYLAEICLEAGDTNGAEEARKSYVLAYPEQPSIDKYLAGRILFANRFSRKSIEEARDKFALAAKMNPGLYRASYFQAICELDLGQTSKARVPLEQYLRSNPTDLQARRLWTWHFDTPPSLSELQARSNRLISEDAPDPDTMIFTIEDILKHPNEADHTLAQRIMEKVIAVAPRDPRGYNALAGLHVERGEIPQAEAVLQHATEAGVDESRIALMRTGILLVKGEKDAAMAAARTYLENAQRQEVRNWTNFFSGQGFFDEADTLMKDFGGEGVPGSETDDPLFYRLTLALQHGRMDQARARVAEAEASRGQNPDLVKVLNKMRMALAEGLVLRPDANSQAEVDELVAKVRASDPEDDSLKIVEARIMLKAALPDIQGAQTRLKEISENSPVYLQALQIQAEIAGMLVDPDKVVEFCRSILVRTPDNNEVLFMLADAQLKQGKLADARASLETILTNNPKDARAMRLLVPVYEQQGLQAKADDMFALFKETGRDRPGQVMQVEELRKFLDRAGSQPDPALASIDVLEATAETIYSSLTLEVSNMVKEKRFAEAIAQVEAYLKKNPNEAEPWAFLGQVILAQDQGADLGAASTAFTRATVILPGYVPAVLGMVKVLIRENNLPAAITLCTQFLKKHDRAVDVMFQLAALLGSDASRHDDALSWIDQAIAIEERPEFYRFKAYLFNQMKREDDAIAELAHLVELTGAATADDELILAEAYLGKGDRSGASEHLAAARKLVPDGDARLTERLKLVEGKLAPEGAN